MFRCKFSLALLLVLPSATLNMHAQDIAGQWQGTIQSGHPLRVVLKVSLDSAGKLQAYLVSIDQGPDHIPVTTISMTHGELDFSIAMIQGTYHGKLSDEISRVDGTWTQGSPLPLVFQRATEETSWLTKSTTRLIAVAPGVSLEVIDWGGSGRRLFSLPDWETRPISSTTLRRNSCRSTTRMESRGEVLARQARRFPMVPTTAQISLETMF
jgi:hypothetical protein